MTPPIDALVVLSTPSCFRCKTVAKHLDKYHPDYVYIDVTLPENQGWADLMREKNLTQVPQTVRNGEWVEGVDFAAIEGLF